MVPTDDREPASPSAPSSVQSVDRALVILELLARNGEVGVTQLAADLGVHKSTASRLVAVLEQHDLVEQVRERGKYRLGFGVIRLAGATTARLDLPRASQPVCDELAAELGETVNVAVLDGDDAVNVCQASGRASVASVNWVGRRTPLHATSSGKVLLAYLAPAVLQRALSGPLEAVTEATLTDPAELRRDLDHVRQVGWARCEEALELGLNAVAAPIRGPSGEVIAALSVAGPSYRITPEAVPGLGATLIRAADRVSERLGLLDPH